MDSFGIAGAGQILSVHAERQRVNHCTTVRTHIFHQLIQFYHHHHHFWQAPLRVRSAEHGHQSPAWMVLSQVNCVVHIEVAGF